MPGQPNILLITTDQHRFDCLACYGHPVVRTPHIDALAGAGVRFEHCFVPFPICQPTRASILTGRYPHEHGVTANLVDLPPNEKTFVRHLTEAGYFTASIGSVQPFPPDEPFGFNYVDAVYQKNGTRDNYREYLKSKGLLHLDGQAKGEKLPFEVYTSALTQDDYADAYVGRKAAAFIDARPEQPFMMWVGFCGPHFPFDPPEPFDRMYDPSDVPLSPPDDLSGKPAMRDWHRIMGFDRLTAELIRKIRAHYYGNITLIDAWIGRMVAALDRAKLRDNTVIILTSDHGELLGEHGLLWKCEHSMYDPSVRVPFIINGVKSASGPRVRSEFIESVDIAPTLLDLAGVDILPEMQGRSILPLLQDRDKNWRDAAFSEGRAIQTREGLPYDSLDLPVVMIRHDRWKLIWHRQDESLSELYDIQADPLELKNLIGEEQFKPVVAQLRERILLWRFDTQRPLHGQVCATFREQMDRPLTRGDRERGKVTWAKP